jgi:hypothetical protein
VYARQRRAASIGMLMAVRLLNSLSVDKTWAFYNTESQRITFCLILESWPKSWNLQQ